MVSDSLVSITHQFIGLKGCEKIKAAVRVLAVMMMSKMIRTDKNNNNTAKNDVNNMSLLYLEKTSPFNIAVKRLLNNMWFIKFKILQLFNCN